MKKMVKDLEVGQWVTTCFAVRAVNMKRSKNNKDYFVYDLYDSSGNIKGYLWNVPKTGAAIKPNCYVMVKGYVKSINYTKLIQIKRIRMATKNDADLMGYMQLQLFASNDEPREKQQFRPGRGDSLMDRAGR